MLSLLKDKRLIAIIVHLCRWESINILVSCTQDLRPALSQKCLNRVGALRNCISQLFTLSKMDLVQPNPELPHLSDSKQRWLFLAGWLGLLSLGWSSRASIWSFRKKVCLYVVCLFFCFFFFFLN